MLFTICWAPREVSEATIVCYLQHVGPPGRYRRPRLDAIDDTLGLQGGIGGHDCIIYKILNSQGDIGGHDCMLFTTLWAPREVSARQDAQGGPQVKGYIHRSRTDAASAFLNMYGLLQPWS